MEQTDKLPAIERSGRIPKTKDNKDIVWTSARIKQAADLFVKFNNSNLRTVTLACLYEFGALTEQTLLRMVIQLVAVSNNPASFRRRLYGYEREGLIEPLSRDVLRKARRAGLPEPEQGILRAYRLGPVGLEIAAFKFTTDLNIPLSTNTITEDYLTHDLLCAEAMLKMQSLWLALADSEDPGIRKSAGRVKVSGPNDISVWDQENHKALLAPDGLLIKRDMKGVFQRAFLIEYHNNNARMHVKNKLEKYERLARKEYDWIWQSWGLAEMPWITVLYRQDATLQHYQEELSNRREVVASYAAVSLADVWAGKLSIRPIKIG
jgi:hypothetical protein